MKNTTFLFISLCFVMPACEQRENEAQKYYNSIKESLHAKTDKIEAILKSATDLPEADLQKAMETSFAFPADLTAYFLEKKPVKSKLFPLSPEECVIADVEAEHDKDKGDYWPAEDINIPDVNIQLNNNPTYAMLKKDSIPNIIVEELQKNIAPFQQCKYLVVVDCMNTLYPTHVSNAYKDEFNPGALLKKVVIYEVDTKAIVDSFHIYSTSSKSVRTQYGGGLSRDVINNFSILLQNALFK